MAKGEKNNFAQRSFSPLIFKRTPARRLFSRHHRRHCHNHQRGRQSPFARRGIRRRRKKKNTPTTPLPSAYVSKLLLLLPPRDTTPFARCVYARRNHPWPPLYTCRNRIFPKKTTHFPYTHTHTLTIYIHYTSIEYTCIMTTQQYSYTYILLQILYCAPLRVVVVTIPRDDSFPITFFSTFVILFSFIFIYSTL